jgi:hypothetical protein
LVAAHTEVSQCGDGELRGREIKRIIGAAVMETEYASKFTTESVWRKVRFEFPENLQPAHKISVEDARMKWTTHDNLEQWFDDVKDDILKTGLVIDQEVRALDGMLLSELDFQTEEVKRRFINMDETFHDLSITGDKGGPRATTYHNKMYQRGPSRRSVKSTRHVTGVYATNAGGESLPPMYIFDSSASTEENYRVKLEWLKGLPTITGRFGCPSMIESSSFYAVRGKGSMDESLLAEYIDLVVLPLYPNIAKNAMFNTTSKRKCLAFLLLVCILLLPLTSCCC